MGSLISKTNSTTNDDIATFRIVWLDSNINDDNKNRAAQQRLRQFDKNLTKFDNQELFQKYIMSTLSDDRIVLIVSGQLGKEVVPKIYKLQQVRSIYVYCWNPTLHEEWTRTIKKIKIVTNKLSEIISQIQSDQEDAIFSEDSSSKNISSTPNHYCAKIDDPLDSPIAFLECFIRMEAEETDRTKCISYCQKKYKNDQRELELINEFQQTYRPERAIWWYTRQSFVNKTLSKILREENIRLIHIFLFLIRDLYVQLKECQCQSSTTVFRGQLLPDNDVVYVKTLVGQTVIIKSFFTTCLDRNYAISSLKNSTKELKKVLFEINIDNRSNTCKPFGKISLYSAYPNNEELLFMAGSNFRIDTIDYVEDHIWVVRMTFRPEESQNWKRFLQHIDFIKHTEDKLNLLSFCTIMRRMGYLTRARDYCYRLLNGYSSDNLLAANICMELSKIASIQGNSNEKAQWYKQALDIQNKYGLISYRNNAANANNDINVVSTLQNSSQDFDSTINGLMTSQRFTNLQLNKDEDLIPIRFYENVPLVSLEQAVLPLVDLLPNIQKMVELAIMKCKQPADGLTQDQSAAIMLYTMECEEPDKCVYFLLNKTLREAEQHVLKPWLLYLKLIRTALSRLPSKQSFVFRGVKLNLSTQYLENDMFYWWSFSSCTTKMNILKSDKFLGSTGARTLFAIETNSGKDITRHSFYQNENEVLLLPGTRFQVIACLPFGTDVHLIQLKEIQSELTFLQSIM